MKRVRSSVWFLLGVALVALPMLAFGGSLSYPASGPTLPRVPSPTFAPSPAGVVWASPINQLYTSGRLPVTINMVAQRVVNPATVATLAKGLLRGGIQGYVVQTALAAAVQAAGYECDISYGCRTVAVAAESIPATAVANVGKVWSWTGTNANYQTVNGSSPVAVYQLMYPGQAITGCSQDGGAYYCLNNGVWSGRSLAPGVNPRCTVGMSDPGIEVACSGNSYTCGAGYTLSGETCTRAAVASVPATDPQLDTVIEGLGDGIKRDVVQQSYEHDVPIEAGPQVMSGPASVTSAPQVTTITQGGNTTVTNTTTTVTNNYAGDTVSSTVTNNISSTVNGVPSSETTETTPDTPEEAAAVTDTPLGEMPVLYVRKYPDGMGGVWETRSAEIKASPLFALSAVFTPTVAGGSCPTWTYNANIGPGMMLGTGSIAPPCWLWPMLKAVLIITALLLARSLIFGG